MAKLKEIIVHLEQFAPISYQESYDNSGLLLGERDMEISSALLCLDIDEEIIDEAIDIGSNLIISHHPLVFKGLKRFTTDSYIARVLLKAIKSDIAIYCCHTNIDMARNGVSYKIAERLHLKNIEVLVPQQDSQSKLIIYTPEQAIDVVRSEMLKFGGVIGNYSQCCYTTMGEGRFKASQQCEPYIGSKNIEETVAEAKIEMIIENWQINKCLQAVKAVHPYQELGYDILPLKNENQNAGLGVIGDLEEQVDTLKFIDIMANSLECKVVRHSDIEKKKVRRVAICGGSGASLVDIAIKKGADIYLSADFKYHDFYLEKKSITIADIGHYEGEKYTLEIFYDIISKKIPNFATHYAKMGNNPINYFINRS